MAADKEWEHCYQINYGQKQPHSNPVDDKPNANILLTEEEINKYFNERTEAYKSIYGLNLRLSKSTKELIALAEEFHTRNPNAKVSISSGLALI